MIEAIKNHRSIRKYQKKEIPANLLEEILLAGTRASTTGNMQVYSVIVTTDNVLKEKLWECHFKQDMVLQAPVILTFCADFNRFSKWCMINEAKPGYNNFLSFFTAAIDAMLVAQNVCLEAENKGLGICYLGTTTYMAEKIINVLKLPELVVPVTTVVLGYSDEEPGLTDRLPLGAVLHHETYQNYSEKSIKQLFSEKEQMEFYKNIVKENGLENLAQVFAQKRYTRNDNVFFSKALLSVLEKQGFMNNE